MEKEEKILKIKSGHKEFVLTEKDRILFNGCAYILITQKILKGYSSYSPTLTKSKIKKLIKSGSLILDKEKYTSLWGEELDLYRITGK